MEGKGSRIVVWRVGALDSRLWPYGRISPGVDPDGRVKERRNYSFSCARTARKDRAAYHPENPIPLN